MAMHTTWSTRGRVAVAVPVLGGLLVALGACGSSSNNNAGSPSASSWVHSFCTDFKPFLTTAQNGEKKLEKNADSVAAHGGLPALRNDLLSFVQSVDGAAVKAQSQIKGLGAPNVSGGSQVESAIVTALGRAHTALQTAETSIRNLNTSNATAFASEADKLGSTVKSSLSNAGSGLSSSNAAGKALTKYVKQDPSCGYLSSSS